MNDLVIKGRQREILNFIVSSNLENAMIASMDPAEAPFTTKELKEFCAFIGLSAEYESQVPYLNL